MKDLAQHETELRFVLPGLDQTYLSPMIVDLEAVLTHLALPGPLQ